MDLTGLLHLSNDGAFVFTHVDDATGARQDALLLTAGVPGLGQPGQVRVPKADLHLGLGDLVLSNAARLTLGPASIGRPLSVRGIATGGGDSNHPRALLTGGMVLQGAPAEHTFDWVASGATSAPPSDPAAVGAAPSDTGPFFQGYSHWGINACNQLFYDGGEVALGAELRVGGDVEVGGNLLVRGAQFNASRWRSTEPAVPGGPGTTIHTFCNVAIGRSTVENADVGGFPPTGLDVQGSIRTRGVFIGDGSLLTFGGAGAGAVSSQWVTSPDAPGIYLLGSNVGIGTDAPTDALQVQGTVQALGGIRIGGTADATFYQRNFVSSQWTNAANGTSIFLNDGRGVAIGAPYAPYLLSVDGDVFSSTAMRTPVLEIRRPPAASDAVFEGSAGGGAGLLGTGTQWVDVVDPSTSNQSLYYAADVALGGSLFAASNVHAGGDFVTTSDARLKTDLRVLDGALAKIRRLAGYTFLRTDLDSPGEPRRHVGLVAQEVEAVLKEAVYTDANGYKTVAYGNVVALLLEGIKELDRKMEGIGR